MATLEAQQTAPLFFHVQSSERFLDIVHIFGDHLSIPTPFYALGQVYDKAVTIASTCARLCSANKGLRKPLAYHQQLLSILT